MQIKKTIKKIFKKIKLLFYKYKHRLFENNPKLKRVILSNSKRKSATYKFSNSTYRNIYMCFNIENQKKNMILNTILTYHLSRQGVNGLHIYHIIKPSKWPVLMSILLFTLAVGFIVCLHPAISPFTRDLNFAIMFILFLSVFYFWCFDLMNESGEHNSKIRQGIKMGMVLFILSEFMFFFAFFWAYFHSSINPTLWIGYEWPPVGQSSLIIESISLPFLNTLLLLTSGFCVTLSHKFSSILFLLEESIINLKFRHFINISFNNIKTKYSTILTLLQIIFSFNFSRQMLRIGLAISLLFTIVLAFIFTNVQYNEYVEANFNISDGIFASCFYLMTGFHGIHVIIGTIFLIACFIQVRKSQRFYKEMTGLDCAIWYWHFVDVVWLFLYIIVYLSTDDAYNRESNISLLEYLFDLEKSFNIFTCGCLSNIGCIKGYAVPNQLTFMYPVTTGMSEAIWLHDYIMFFIIIIFFIVVSVLYGILKEHTTVPLYEFFLKYKQFKKEKEFNLKYLQNNKKFNENYFQSKQGKTIYEAERRTKTY